MELKRIIARDTRAANEKAIQLYGEDVLIISTQRVDNQTELIVAVDVRPGPQLTSDAASEAAPKAATSPVVRQDSLPHAAASAMAASPSTVLRSASSQPLGQSPAPVAARVMEASHAAATPFVSFSDWLQGAMTPSALGPAKAPDMPSQGRNPAPAETEAPAMLAETSSIPGSQAARAAPERLPAALVFEGAVSPAGASTSAAADMGPSTDSTPPDTPPVRASRSKRQPANPSQKPGSAAEGDPVRKNPTSRQRTKATGKPDGTAVASRDADQTQAHELRRSQEIVDLLRQEMAVLRQEFALSRQLGALHDLRECAPAIGQLAASLTDLGVPVTLRTLLLDGVREMDDAAQALKMMQQTLERSLAREASDHTGSLRGVHALCGPSGAGKSAMVARLACAAARQHGAEQVAMISLADSRPGAWGQLQVLAAQAGVDCYRASDIDMLRVLLDELQLRTVVFIDTAGTDFLQQAQALGREMPKVQCHAVLPVDATVTSVQKIFHTPDMRWSCLMLSKMDEAAHPWPLVQALCNHAMPVGAVSLSDRITESPSAFDAAKLAALALAGLKPQPDESSAAMTPAVKAPAVRRSRKAGQARPVSARAESAHA